MLEQGNPEDLLVSEDSVLSSTGSDLLTQVDYSPPLAQSKSMGSDVTPENDYVMGLDVDIIESAGVCARLEELQSSTDGDGTASSGIELTEAAAGTQKIKKTKKKWPP